MIDKRFDNQFGKKEVYSVLTCSTDTIILSESLSITREKFSVMVLLIDSFVTILLYIAMVRMKWFEQKTIED